MNKWWLLPFAALYLVMLVTQVPSIGHDLISTRSYTVTYPEKLEPEDGKEIEGRLSYAILLEGIKYIVRLTQNRESFSSNTTVYTYIDEEKLTVEHAYIRNDCYYQGFMEGIEYSTVALSTCDGLSGFLQMANVSFGIYPIDLSKRFRHMVYRLGYVPSPCGVKSKDAEINRTGFIPKTNQRNPYIMARRRYIELIVSVDYTLFAMNKKNAAQLHSKLLELVHLTDAMFDILNIDIILVGIDMWTQNYINYEEAAQNILDQFELRRNKHFKNRIHCDAASLFIYPTYSWIHAMANKGTVCSSVNPVSFVMVMEPVKTAVMLAHQLGHSLNLAHDSVTCSCSSGICTMSPAMNAIATVFSDCSINTYTQQITDERADCLLNIPSPDIALNLCGNKLLDGEEECDCGTEEECKADPCCGTKCKLRTGAQCSNGTCCENCMFINEGQPCRIPVSECDLAEYCSGVSNICPSDVYSQDGTPCNDGQSLCYQNNCHDPNRYCRKIFGRKARSASLACFSQLNTIGDRFGNCGYENKQFKKCESKNVMCGQPKCEKATKIRLKDNHTAIIQFAAGKTWCWGLDYHDHMKMPDIGMRTEGAKCGEGKICVNRKCVFDAVLDYDCDVATKCNGRGVCNNKKNCHCDKEWAPPDCVNPGYGGSLDSGPLVNGSFIIYVYPPEEDEEEEEEEEE
ncbi:disintegrin and metalloproteinase domain-containing protein 9-like, partial [Rhinatrema bivittatum]|uniref:disintegrin and metalloproteinase domain-containing protein 9-like n=1 Tax=Rhinatrema bivittatum TaxID=194408 RepID=UPI00112EAD07